MVDTEAEASRYLARLRAHSVAKYLVDHGVAREKIVIEAAGDSEPEDSSDSATAYAKNRRVQIIWE